ncbi:MAG: hypothetical protein DLM53_01770 [Candidatus Eremiobacter antarcticus]|nr:hypothetical protein [Candidatus Eremiobacteraeota bacterium]MBC5808133.1 hypothetical protein [Candidatus Eremiobacteraeota bacterium]PZR63531.1 MAG: hypothetical protein DLM53_01770 [Candidatus Eremiobacter sp. RRmetagenome_bin22]
MYASIALMAAALILILFVQIGRYIGDRALMHERRGHAAPISPLPQSRARIPLPSPSRFAPRASPASTSKP